jgi:hypothetical protein
MILVISNLRLATPQQEHLAPFQDMNRQLSASTPTPQILENRMRNTQSGGRFQRGYPVAKLALPVKLGYVIKTLLAQEPATHRLLDKKPLISQPWQKPH